MKLRLNVIVDAQSGDVVATQQAADSGNLVIAQSPDSSTTLPVHRRIVPGPDQLEYEVDVDVPESAMRTSDVDQLHAAAYAAVTDLRRAAP